MHHLGAGRDGGIFLHRQDLGYSVKPDDCLDSRMLDKQGQCHEKKRILEWLVKNKINDVNGVGRIVSEYYIDPERILERIKK